MPAPKRGRADYGEVREVLFPGFVTVGGIPSIAPIVIVPSRFGTLPGVSATNTGFVGGGQIGYNWQVSNFVFGLEADVNWNRVRPSLGFNVPDPFLIQTLTGSYTTEIDWTSSFRGRVGMAFDRLLVYATGGAAIAGGRVNSSFTLNTPITGIIFPFRRAAPRSPARTSRASAGRSVADLSTRSLTTGASRRIPLLGFRQQNRHRCEHRPAGFASLGIFAQTISTRLRTDEATLRLNYRFDAGPGPVVARY